jgi:uncharacterized protein
MQSQTERKPNRLIREKSPYLLQHAYNPVDWFPWGKEAFTKAHTEDKPIFLSIGYSTCYWCHVMEREVFENDSIAALMNEKLVCIKVDREERPDVDRIYMSALQATTGSGGWPLSAFLAPDLKPFYTATYIRPESHHGRPGFPELVNRISDLWTNQRDKITLSCNRIVDHLNSELVKAPIDVLDESIITNGYDRFLALYDPELYGFGSEPKFPRPAVFNFLLRYFHRTGNGSSLKMVLNTLRAMARGGMYVHLGGGFHRYSVDAQWRLPHFEKMLYDQAQLAISYLEAYQITHDTEFADMAKKILHYCLMTLHDPDGGFYSAEDAESGIDSTSPDKKEEGAFYFWTKSEIDYVLGSHTGDIFSYYYGIEHQGNILEDHHGVFVGRNVLYIAHEIEETAKKFNIPKTEIEGILRRARETLFNHRANRPHPHRDNKIITAWNGLIISALAKAYTIFRDDIFLTTARATATFIIQTLYDPNTQTLYRRYCDGEVRHDGGLQDYTFFVQGLIDLYEASFDFQWLESALSLTKIQIYRFGDPANGGFYESLAADRSLLVRMKDDYDGAEPAGNSVAALNLFRLAHLTDNSGWRSLAEQTIKLFGERLAENPEALPQMVAALCWYFSAPREIILAGSRESASTRQMLDELHRYFIPNKILILIENETKERLSSFLPFLQDIPIFADATTAYICRNYACQLPTSDVNQFRELLEQ